MVSFLTGDIQRAKEEGGRIYAVEHKGKEAFLSFGRRDFNLHPVHVGDKVWKTSDPELELLSTTAAR